MSICTVGIFFNQKKSHTLPISIFENPYQDMVHIDNITLVLVSPLRRAQQTYQQLWEGGLANEAKSGNAESSCFTRTQARTTSLLTEWDYGDYEGVTTKDILKTRPTWSLFGDNAPNGETVEQVSARCDAIIELIHNYQRGIDSQGNTTSVLRMPFTEVELKEDTSLPTTEGAEAQIQVEAQAQAFVQENGSLANTKTIVTIPQSKEQRDVLIVAHGHLLRVLAARWLKMDGLMGRNFVLDTASVSVLGYEHTLEERVIKVWNQGNHLWKNQTRVG